MPQWFTFVVPNYFQSTVRHRPETPSLVDEGDETVESDAKDIMNPSASNQVKALISASSSCGTLGKLPLELRTMIYTRVLGSEKYIKNPHKWLDRHPPIMAKEAEHIKVIDAALLRTCRTIYQEALQILYGRNRFNFYKSEDVTTFAHFGLGETPFGYHRAASEPSSAVSDAPYGRLTMVSRLHLRFAGGRSTSWSSWCNFFYPPEKHTQLIGFPALQRLSLDLVEWQLGAEDASMIRVRFDLSFYLRPLFSRN